MRSLIDRNRRHVEAVTRGAIWSALWIVGVLALASPFLTRCDAPGSRYSGTVMETRGQCWHMRSDPLDGKRTTYAVKADFGRTIDGFKPGRHVSFRARLSTKKDCLGAVLLESAE